MNIQSTAIERESTNIAGLGELLRTQQISPVEIVTTCLRRIEQSNPQLNAFITVLPGQAMPRTEDSQQHPRPPSTAFGGQHITGAVKAFSFTRSCCCRAA
jgi:Asp-tRNA(Asn)/Glu-tRNA(Gln) amidotransferase A subunit family amidase